MFHVAFLMMTAIRSTLLTILRIAMLNFIWIFLMLAAVLIGSVHHTLSAVVLEVTQSAKNAAGIAIGLVGIMAFWLGLMKIAEDAGCLKALSRCLSPLMQRLFPEVPPQHPAMSAMIMNISANIFGLGNAATPFGLRAMQELERLNTHPGIASHSMCLFLAINTSSVQLIPATGIGILSLYGAHHPANIIIPCLLATTCSTVTGIVCAKFFAKLKYFRFNPETKQA